MIKVMQNLKSLISCKWNNICTKLIFYSGNDALKISPDKTKAAYYYQLCKTDNCVHPGGCWALGDMVLKGEFNVPNKDERDYAKKLFKLCGDYAPAQDSIAKIEKSIGDDYFSQYKAIPPQSPGRFSNKNYNSLY